MKRFLIWTSIVAGMVILALATTQTLPHHAFAAAIDDVRSGVTTTGDSGKVSITGVIKAVVQILSFVVGVAAVIMIIISGIKYVTSNGDSSAISSAKNTLIYALVGLVIAALAQALVKFVLDSVSK